MTAFLSVLGENLCGTERGAVAEDARRRRRRRKAATRAQLNALIDLAEAGLKEIFAAQRAVLGE